MILGCVVIIPFLILYAIFSEEIVSLFTDKKILIKRSTKIFFMVCLAGFFDTAQNSCQAV